MENIHRHDDVEQLFRRIEDLEEACDKLKETNSIISRQRTLGSLTTMNGHSSVSLTEAQYFNILQSIDEPIHITDDKGRLIYRNPAWEKLYGYSVAESQGKDVVELIIGPTDVTIANNIMEHILKGAIHGGEFVVRNNKGARFLSFGSSEPLRHENGKIIGIIAVSAFPRPFPEITPHPKVGAPTTTASHQPIQSDLATTVEKEQVSSMMISDYKQPVSPKAEWMVKNGIPSSWKGNERKGPTFDSRFARACWHWLYHSDHEHEYVMPPKVASQPWVDASTLGQWCSSFDKVYEVKWEDLIIRECIGRGSYGTTLYHAVWCGSDVALKLFPKQQYSHDLMFSFKREVSVLKRLRHPNILLFMGAAVSPQRVCIVTEFLCRGSLFQLLHRRRGRFNMKHRVHMALDIARGMNYLHCCLPSIIHGDLNSSNLRVDKKWTVKISDFGLCRPKHETKEGIGTPEWMAPEVLHNEVADEKSDVYSYGVVLWEMTTEKIPWDGLSSIQVIKAVGFMNQRLDIPKDVDPQWASLIDRCLCSEPDSRPTFQHILDELKELQKNMVHATDADQKC